MATEIDKAPAALQELVAKVDTGARKPVGFTGQLIFGVALAWALFQFWYASPLPFTFGFGILNDTEARSLHLAFAMFLAFTAWPAFDRSPRDHVPIARLAFRARRRVRRRVSDSVLSRARVASRTADDDGHRRRVDRALVAARSNASGRGLADGGARAAVHRVQHGRSVPARGARAQGRVAFAAALAHVAHDRGRVRYRARRIHRNDLRLRAVRHVARPRRRRQLHDASQLRRARSLARRARRRWRSCRRR